MAWQVIIWQGAQSRRPPHVGHVTRQLKVTLISPIASSTRAAKACTMLSHKGALRSGGGGKIWKLICLCSKPPLPADLELALRTQLA